ncbi:MAG: glycine--tRNA ligase subunit beta [Elusimicrobia bacterium]|nr:glycine--tRNA ligase subunit beta [Elusimicrobiota bacterium]
MKDFLLEIGVENLPSRFIPPALEQLKDSVCAALKEKRLSFVSARTLGTYKRLSLLLEGVEEKSPDGRLEAFGPPASLYKDAAGNFTPQCAGFARSHGLKPEDVRIVEAKKGRVLCVDKKVKGEPAQKILSEAVSAAVSALQFPKNMVWEPGLFRFARPIRSLVALYGDKVVPLEIAGVKSGRKTTGLDASGAKALSIKSASDYERVLADACVMACPQKRRQTLADGIRQASARLGCTADDYAPLLEEMVYLTENPVPLAGSFSKDFLRLPRELIMTVFRHQLKLFTVYGKDGALAPSFVAVRDGVSENQDEVQTGYQGVVEARLTDAVFFFDNDRRNSLERMREKLKGVVYHEKMGTLHQKSERVVRLAGYICEQLKAQKVAFDEKAVLDTASYAYADLTSEVVREFPELQGYMGGEYAAHCGLPSNISAALKEFYLPAGAKGPIPSTIEGCIASLAGKLDTLAGDFSLGMIPSGSEDPNGLRRQALGAVRIVQENGLHLSLSQLLLRAMDLIGEDITSPAQSREAVVDALEEFLWQRLEAVCQDKGMLFDEIRAVKGIGLASGTALSNPTDVTEILARLEALHAVRQDPDFLSLAASFKRVSNILRQAAKDLAAGLRVDETAFVADQERDLYKAMLASKKAIEPLLWNDARHPQRADFEAALKELSSLKPQVDAFFEKVMVNDPNVAVRKNRLALMSELHALLGVVADISQLQQ